MGLVLTFCDADVLLEEVSVVVLLWLQGEVVRSGDIQSEVVHA